MSDACRGHVITALMASTTSPTPRRGRRRHLHKPFSEGAGLGMNTHLRTPALLAAALLLSVAATSCTGNDPDPDGSLSPAPTSTPSETSDSPSPTPLSETEQAAQDVEALVRRYFAVVDQVNQDDTVPARRLRSVTGGVQLKARQIALERHRDGGRRQIGELVVRELVVENMNLDGTPTAKVDVCWDVSGVDVVDANGNSVVLSNRVDLKWTRYTVTNDRWSSNPHDGWRVVNGSDLEKEPCAG